MKKLIALPLIALLLVTSAAAASIDELNAAKEEVAFHQSQKDAAHTMAEAARQLGFAENHTIITVAQEAWHEHNMMAVDAQLKVDQIQAEVSAKRPLGTFRITHYCPGRCCNGGYTGTALGTTLQPWYTAAVDPKVIALGSTIHIEGYGDFVAEDTGGAIKGNRIDICVPSHEEAMSLGVVYKEVYLK